MKTAVCFCLGLIMLGAAPTTKPITRPATQPKKVFTSCAQVMAVVPPGLLPEKATGWTDLMTKQANKALEPEVKGQVAHLPMGVIDVQESPKFILVTGLVKVRDTYVRLLVSYTNNEENKAALSKLERGKPVVADGTIYLAGFVQPKGQEETELVIVIDGALPKK